MLSGNLARSREKSFRERSSFWKRNYLVLVHFTEHLRLANKPVPALLANCNGGFRANNRKQVRQTHGFANIIGKWRNFLCMRAMIYLGDRYFQEILGVRVHYGCDTTGRGSRIPDFHAKNTNSIVKLTKILDASSVQWFLMPPIAFSGALKPLTDQRSGSWGAGA
jgi:hypothetical protein